MFILCFISIFAIVVVVFLLKKEEKKLCRDRNTINNCIFRFIYPVTKAYIYIVNLKFVSFID